MSCSPALYLLIWPSCIAVHTSGRTSPHLLPTLRSALPLRASGSGQSLIYTHRLSANFIFKTRLRDLPMQSERQRERERTTARALGAAGARGYFGRARGQNSFRPPAPPAATEASSAELSLLGDACAEKNYVHACTNVGPQALRWLLHDARQCAADWMVTRRAVDVNLAGAFWFE